MGNEFIDPERVTIYTKEQVLKLFKNYQYDIEQISKNFYKNYVDNMYMGCFNALPPKSWSKAKILEFLKSYCFKENQHKEIENQIIDITQ